jgi:hypothetical protein
MASPIVTTGDDECSEGSAIRKNVKDLAGTLQSVSFIFIFKPNLILFDNKPFHNTSRS